jgi:hypothetical protein
LAVALEPVLHNWGQHYDKGFVYIDHADFAGTTDQAIQAIVDAAPVTSPRLDAKDEAERLSLVIKAAFRVMLSGLNLERQTSGRPQLSWDDFVTAVKQEIDRP